MSNKKYQKIIILGSIGSGKTSLAKQINKRHHIPVYHLDKEYWQPNWIRPSAKDWEEKITNLSNQTTWVMDGNYIETLEVRLSKADLVIMLDIKKRICIRGLFFRTLKGLFIRRNDLGKGCKDSFNKGYSDLVEWAKQFKERYYPELLKKCQLYPHVDIKIFKTRKEARMFVERELNNE